MIVKPLSFFSLASIILFALFFSNSTQSSIAQERNVLFSTSPLMPIPSPLAKDLPKIPTQFSYSAEEGFKAVVKSNGIPDSSRSLTLDPELQMGLEHFLETHGNQISALVMVEVKTGRILALAQGRNPTYWSDEVHTALHTGFPAASIFKIVGASAALEEANFDPKNTLLSVPAGCSEVRDNGTWWKEFINPRKILKLSLKEAFGDSCNGYFAKLAVNHVGLDLLNKYADRFRWGKTVPTDFFINPSPILQPNVKTTSMQTAGLYAAGFGGVGLSAVHAAWLFTGLARGGEAIPLRLFSDAPEPRGDEIERILSQEASVKLKTLLHSTTLSGTARGAFSKKKYRNQGLQDLVGGKTGTLTGRNPVGKTTWFVGMMPLDDPEVVVAAVVVTGNKWVIKATNAAAEALSLYIKKQEKEEDEAATH